MTLLNRDNYPNIDPFDVGLRPNVGWGIVEDVRCHAIEAGAAHRLVEELTKTATSFALDNVEGYPSAPFIVQVSEERMVCNSIDLTTKTLSVSRGYDNTEAAIHNKNKVVFEVRPEYIYKASGLPITSIDKVYIKGNEQVSQFRAYTGRAGDEHDNYPGKSVIVFPAEMFIGPQRNLEYSGETESGEVVDAEVEIPSRKELTDGVSTTFVQMSALGVQNASVTFKGFGGIKRTVYSADVDESSSSDPATVTLIISSRDNIIKKKKTYTMVASESNVFEIAVEAGEWTDIFYLRVDVGEVDVYDMSASVIKVSERYGPDEINNATATAVKDIEVYNNGKNSLVTYKN